MLSQSMIGAETRIKTIAAVHGQSLMGQTLRRRVRLADLVCPLYTQFSAAFTTNIAESNFRYTQPVFMQRLRAMVFETGRLHSDHPWQNAYVERLIGSIRRECLDHMIVFGEAHLRRILGAYAAYYNESRTHRSLNKDAPLYRAIERLGAITSHPILGGLHHQYCRI
jgi:hypothetical protein